jgi:endonuclease/exonuclease/phosphatase (EEP) superfamily protein YafD
MKNMRRSEKKGKGCEKAKKKGWWGEGENMMMETPQYRMRTSTEEGKIRSEIRVISWNINGVQNEEKIQILKKMAAGFRPLFIMLQETKTENKEDMTPLMRGLKKFEWYVDSYRKGSRGVAIGVRKMKGREGVCEKVYFEEQRGSLFGIKTKVFDKEFGVLNLYKHKELRMEDVLSSMNRFFQPLQCNIMGGDFNVDFGDDQFQILMNTAAELKMERLSWNNATHHMGRCIDHLFVPSDCPPEWRILNALPTRFKDHAIMVGGSIRKEWNVANHHQRRSIPNYIACDPDFGQKIRSMVGDYKKDNDDPWITLGKIKEAAWKLTPEWRDRIREKSIFNKLWQLQFLLRNLNRSKCFRKSTVSFPYSSLELEILGEAETKRIKKKLERNNPSCCYQSCGESYWMYGGAMWNSERRSKLSYAG